MTMATARDTYLRLAEPAEDANAELGMAIRPAAFTTVRAAVRRYAAANRALAAGLRSARWPVSVQPAMDKLIHYLLGQQPQLDSMSQDTTAPRFFRDFNAYHVSPATADQVRLELGLPPAR